MGCFQQLGLYRMFGWSMLVSLSWCYLFIQVTGGT
uniref:Uncharacterized protein n=1 Tax=Arundo donax TaxID=35708 RepID=A0A0A9ER05_ARUDO